MIITWHGQNCFKIQGDKSTLIIDPFDSSIGAKSPRIINTDLVVFTADKKTNAETKTAKNAAGEKPFIIDKPGEYEVAGIFVYGIPTINNSENTTIYKMELDGIKIGHLGNLDHVIANGEIEMLEGIDILLIPVGGGSCLDAKTANEVISQLEPRVIIPMNYKISGIKDSVDSLDNFCKEIGICPTETLPKFKVSKKDLPQDDMKVVTLEP